MTKYYPYFTILSTLFLFIAGCSQKDQSEQEDTRLLGAESILTDSGLEYLFINDGNGPAVTDGKEITTHCILKVGDSAQVWNTREDQEPFVFVYKRDPMIPGFVEIVSQMKEGDRAKVIIPPNLGYGERGAGSDIPPNAVLSFDIEVLNVREPRMPVADLLLAKFQNEGAEEAISYFNEEIKPDPDKYDYSLRQMFVLASKLKQDGRINDQTKVIELAVEEYPESSGAFYLLGQEYANQGRKKEAVEALNKSIELDPENQAAKTLLENIQ